MDDFDYLFLVKTCPREAGDYGGIAYNRTWVIANMDICLEDLRIMVHELLSIPYTSKFRYMWRDSTDKDWENNIIVQKGDMKGVDLSKCKYDSFYTLNLKNYPKQMPDKEAEFTEFSSHEFEAKVREYLEREKEKEVLRERERKLKEMKKLLQEIDKETLIELLHEGF